MRRRLMGYLLVIGAFVVVLALWLRWNEPRMIYYPSRGIDATPDETGLAFEEVWLTTADAVRIHAWFLPAAGKGAGSPTILFLHGNAGNISHRLEKLALFHQLGASTLIIDYRGYGRSEGRPNEAGTYLDAQAAYQHLTKTGGNDPTEIIVYGESLGSAIAVDLAAKAPVGGVIIEEPFTSIADVGQKMFPFLPVRLLVRNKYDTLSKIGRINAPLLIFHSRDDEFFPMRHAHRLLAAARAPKRLVELRGGHNDAFLVSAEAYQQGLTEFLDPWRAS